MHRIFVAMIVVCLLLGTAFSCSNQSPSSPSDDASNEVASEESPADPCGADTECESYYRCINGECAVPPAITGERSDDTPVARFYDGDEEIASFYLELALTLDEQSRGLMFRTEMLDDWGMLFIYEQQSHLSFWMKNTLIYLDMIFIDKTGEVVGVVHEAEPETVTPRAVDDPSRYVLEINGGLARQHGIDRGVTMSLEYVDAHHQPDQ